MNAPSHPRLDILDPLVAGLESAARLTAKTARSLTRRRRKPGESLQPGADTPLWNELTAACAARLTSYGDKARLGRILGMSRQRVHELFVARTACPDAERTLQLLAWLAVERRTSTTSTEKVSSIK